MTAITYPARPINGGPLDKAPAKTGAWFFEPKVNGWRALIHAPTRTMFNRRGQRLSIAHDFGRALDQLQTVSQGCDIAWWDCEALERRHKIGQGWLIVLDYVPLDTQPTYQERRKVLLERFNLLVVARLEAEPLDAGEVYFLPALAEDQALDLWRQLQNINGRLGIEFFEGLVAKLAISIYPKQLRSPDWEFPFWMKHRWAF